MFDPKRWVAFLKLWWHFRHDAWNYNDAMTSEHPLPTRRYGIPYTVTNTRNDTRVWLNSPDMEIGPPYTLELMEEGNE